LCLEAGALMEVGVILATSFFCAKNWIDWGETTTLERTGVCIGYQGLLGSLVLGLDGIFRAFGLAAYRRDGSSISALWQGWQ